MKKILILTAYLFVLFINAYAQNKGQTEIKIQLSESEFVHKLANYSNDSSFIFAFNQALLKYKQGEDQFISILTEILIIENPDCRLIDIFYCAELKDKIRYNSSNQEIINVLNEEINQVKDKTLQVLKRRLESIFKTNSLLIDFFNNPMIEIKKLNDNNNYLIRINRVYDKIPNL